MSMSRSVAKTAQLQAAFAHRREKDQMLVERSNALNRYYDHWDKVNTRFENWTAPAYYEKREQKMQKSKEKKEKDEKLEQRRSAMRDLYKAENTVYDQQKLDKERPRSRKYAASVELLKKIEQRQKEEEQVKRKLELEAKLYGKWRHGVDDKNLIFQSKSENEVLAKLNWLDKQIEEQKEREREAALAEERKLRLQQELNKAEETQKERQQLREQEVKEIRALQERHIEQINSRQNETEELKDEERILRFYKNEVGKELELLAESVGPTMPPSELAYSNIKKIKIYIRTRSEVFRKQIETCLGILERVRKYALNQNMLQMLTEKYKDQKDIEKYLMTQIEAMYESEAKHTLKRLEDDWQKQNRERVNELKEYLSNEQRTYMLQLNENLKRQTEILQERSTHLNAIENSNERLKQLIDEDVVCDERGDVGGGDAHKIDNTKLMKEKLIPRLDTSTYQTPEQSSANALIGAKSSLPQITKSFSNLNLDCWQDLPSARGGIDSPRLVKQRTPQIVTAETAVRPQFGRRRIAWN